jgi:DNA helicase HerA-like ATPase
VPLDAENAENAETRRRHAEGAERNAEEEAENAKKGKGVRVDLSKLPPPLQYLAADTLLDQVFRRRRLDGPQPLSLFLLVDESKLCTPARRDSPLAALNRLATEGRKFGVGLIAASQFVGHLPRDVVVNTFTKLVMKTDPTEIAPTARRFRIDETRLEALRRPGDALVHFADRTEWTSLRVGAEGGEADSSADGSRTTKAGPR